MIKSLRVIRINSVLFLINLLFVSVSCGRYPDEKISYSNEDFSMEMKFNKPEKTSNHEKENVQESAEIDSVPFLLPGDQLLEFSEMSEDGEFFPLAAYAWPAAVKTITSRYGPRSSPCKGCSSFHRGVDIGVGAGSKVFAANGGAVSGQRDSCAGNMMRVTQGGVQTRYFHLSSFLAAGKVVKPGNLIAKSGNTGSCTTGAHLHFEFWVNGQHKNPLNYVK